METAVGPTKDKSRKSFLLTEGSLKVGCLLYLSLLPYNHSLEWISLFYQLPSPFTSGSSHSKPNINLCTFVALSSLNLHTCGLKIVLLFLIFS